VARPPPGQNAISSIVRPLPFFVESAQALTWNASISCGVMGLSLNQSVTLR